MAITTVILLLALSLAPAVAIIAYIYARDKYEPEPISLLLLSFGFGVISTLPAYASSYLGASLGLDLTPNIFTTLLYIFGVIAFSEELAKFLFLRFGIFPKKEFDEPLDGIVYAVMIGMGFATIENIIYVFKFGASVGLARMFTAVPAHAAFGVVMGYYTGLAKQFPEKQNVLLAKALIGATMLHGAYNFFQMQRIYSGLALLSIVTLGFALQFSNYAIRIHQGNSPYRPNANNNSSNNTPPTNV